MSDRQKDAIIAQSLEVFGNQIYAPLFQQAATKPEDVLAAIDEISARLIKLREAVVGLTPHAGLPAPLAEAVLAQSAPHTHTTSEASRLPASEQDTSDEIGRNQRAKLRELKLLELLAEDARPLSLPQIVKALHRAGFTDTNAAIASHLHRLKTDGVIDRPANGMYVLTDEGMKYLRQAKANFGGLR